MVNLAVVSKSRMLGQSLLLALTGFHFKSSKLMLPKKQRYLVLYDYGTGGVWEFIYARSEEEVLQKYPELKIMDEVSTQDLRYLPEMSDDERERVDALSTYDIDDEPRGLLLDILNARKSALR